MANPWCRLWSDLPNDPKWRSIAKVSKQPIATVIAVYIHMMVCASNATERGRTQGWCDEDVANALDIQTEEVAAIRAAMQGRVLEGEELTGWKKRQPAREDGGAERAKQWRDKKKQDDERNRTQPNAGERPDTEEDTEEDKGIDPIPFHEIVTAYNKFCPSLPKVRHIDIGAERTRLIKAVWLKYHKCEGGAAPVLDRLFKKAEASGFLTGKRPGFDGKFFKAKLDWMLNEPKMVKILEGDYDDPPEPPKRKPELQL
jgi:hypothetical protein